MKKSQSRLSSLSLSLSHFKSYPKGSGYEVSCINLKDHRDEMQSRKRHTIDAEGRHTCLMKNIGAILSGSLIMRGSMEGKANDFYSACQHFNFTVIPVVEQWEENNTACNLKTHTRKSIIVEEDPTKKRPINYTCRTMEYPDNCIHIYLYMEMDVKNVTCAMKITWYILVLLVFVFLIILIIHKILEGHRRVQNWQSHKYKPTSVLLRGSDCEKLRALNVRVISAEPARRRPLAQVKEVLPPIPELEVASSVLQQDQYTRLSLGNLD
ncbi:transmembrane protein 156 isoform X5 [Castor canadensis]|uniref:Transmembrane protein 156 isoform X5 n=1 Tax=Castor canadensis TaxID=51338 RepID=A0AC58K0U8_CASCN